RRSSQFYRRAVHGRTGDFGLPQDAVPMRVVGQRAPRVDGVPKVLGSAPYVCDLSRTWMLYGAVLRSPFPHARIRSIDTRRALRLKGVKAVVTADATPRRAGGPSVGTSRCWRSTNCGTSAMRWRPSG